MTIRLVLVDNHVVLRQGLRALLELEPDIDVVGEADNGRDALDVVLETAPDVALIDLSMPEMGGISATQVFHRECPRTRVLILASIDEVDTSAIVGAVRAGAIGVIRKNVRMGVSRARSGVALEARCSFRRPRQGSSWTAFRRRPNQNV